MFKLIGRWISGAFTCSFDGAAGEELTAAARARGVSKLEFVQKAMAFYTFTRKRIDEDGVRVVLIDQQGNVYQIPEQHL